MYGPVDSFFGQSLASLGDFDQDGHNDIAIGAPKDNKTGKVYIYRGECGKYSKHEFYTTTTSTELK